MSMHKHFQVNATGRDFVVGDIHGCFPELLQSLDEIGFDPDCGDRMFSVGDLVDRGPEPEEVLVWLSKPWFHPVMGNHEHMLMEYHAGNLPAEHYNINGGAWFTGLPRSVAEVFVNAIAKLPLAITVESDDGPVGIVHADVPMNDWGKFAAFAEGMGGVLGNEAPRPAIAAMWSRSRVKDGYWDPVEGAARVFVGHTIMSAPLVLGNVHHIDTGAFTPAGHLTICRLDGTVVSPARRAS